jgi:hypothetical protein
MLQPADIDGDEATRPSPLAIFRERASARATLVENGLLDLQTAVDGMQESAAAQGLVVQYGQDEIQNILSAAFSRRLCTR